MILVMTRMITISTPPFHHGRRHLLSGSIGDAEDAALIVIILMSSHILLYIEIKRDVRPPWHCQRCDDDGYQGTSSDAEDVVMIVVMMRMITLITPVPLSSWSSSSLIRQHW